METILSKARIQREAHEAAKTFDDVNAACPYPCGTEASEVFRERFLAERQASNQSLESDQA
jgi:hypothetical protein